MTSRTSLIIFTLSSLLMTLMFFILTSLLMLYTRVDMRPGFPGFVPVLWSVSRCPDDLCKIAKLSRFLTYEEGKEIANSDLGNVSTLSSYKDCLGLSIQCNFSCLAVYNIILLE